jgi:hypothetical protein
MFSHAYCTF